MPTSPHPELPSWDDPAWATRETPDSSDPATEQPAPEQAQHGSDVLVSDAPSVQDNAIPATATPTFDDDVYEAATASDITETVYAAPPGMPPRGVILTSSASALGCAALDFALTGGLTIFFDLCFIVVCLVGAMGIRRRDIFTTGVLAPLIYGGVIAVVALVAPQTFVATGDISKVFLTGLATHASALVAGYAVALATVAGRVSATPPAP